MLAVADAGVPAHLAPAPLEAYFPHTSYAAGRTATLRVSGGTRRLEVRVEHVGERRGPGGFDRRMQARVRSRRLAINHGRLRIRVRRRWPSGVYLVRLRDRRGRVAYAPFVLRRRTAPTRRVAVVLPTNTWQAYNFRDANGDGVGDTWYAGHGQRSVDVTRPFLQPGVPLYFRRTAVPFLRWLEERDLRPAFLSDDDLRRLGPRELRRRYGLLVFAGHEEYVSPEVFRAVPAFADAGGDVMLLSANSFFARVDRRGGRLVRVGRWRDLGRPESAWIGVQYVDWWQYRYPDRPYVARRAPWLFKGTGVRPGDAFGSFGKEVDQRTASSPPGTRVLAEARGIFGPGRSAQMTIRRTAGGGRVFAAGALDFVDHARRPVDARLLDNLWARLAPDGSASLRSR